jgi:Bacterial Ig-like domain (group 3)
VVTIISTRAHFNAALNDWPLSHQNARNNSILQSPLNMTTSTLTAATANPASSVAGQSVALTATVKATLPGAAVPGGTVNFMDGSAVVGACQLTAGTCSANATTFTQGTHTLTAAYLGDAHSTISFSTPFSEAVGAADFSLSASAAQTVDAGASANYTITATPNPVPYDFPVQNLSCTGLPRGTQCSFSPISVTPGNAAGTIALRITTTSRTVLVMAPPIYFRHLTPTLRLLALAFLFAWLVVLRPVRRPKHSWAALTVLVVCGLLASCGGGSSPGGGTKTNPNGTPAGNLTITVSATTNTAATRSTTINLNVN